MDDLKNITAEESAKIKDKDIKIPLSPLFCILTVLSSTILSSAIYLIQRDIIFTFQAFITFILLVWVSAVDIKLHLAPNWVSLAFLILGVPNIVRLLIAGNFMDMLVNYVGGMFVGFILLFISALMTKGGIGAGDIKIMTSLGLVVGLDSIFMGQMFGLLYAAIGSIVLLIFKKADKKTRIPLLPFLSAGVATAMFVPVSTLF